MNVWLLQANKEKLPHFWFYVENQRIDVIANVYFSIYKMLWMGFNVKTPDHYGLFINQQSSITGNSLWVQHREQTAHLRRAVVMLFFLFPIWCAWQLIVVLFVAPVKMCASKCEVRKYVVQVEGGIIRESPAFEFFEPKETTRLLG